MTESVFLSDKDRADYAQAIARIDAAQLELQRAQASAQFLASKFLRQYAGGRPAQIHPETGEVLVLAPDTTAASAAEGAA